MVNNCHLNFSHLRSFIQDDWVPIFPAGPPSSFGFVGCQCQRRYVYDYFCVIGFFKIGLVILGICYLKLSTLSQQTSNYRPGIYNFHKEIDIAPKRRLLCKNVSRDVNLKYSFNSEAYRIFNETKAKIIDLILTNTVIGLIGLN